MRFSDKLIGHLKTNGQFDQFWRGYDGLRSRGKDGRAYANTIAGCMEIAHELNDKKISYCVLGGLAVAFHLRQKDNNAFLNWRGTSDIDLLAAKKVVEGILRENGLQTNEKQISWCKNRGL